MDETLREAPPVDDWRSALAQTIEQQRQKVGQRIAGQRERLRELEGRLSQQLGEATKDLQSQQDAARQHAAQVQAEEAAARQQAADLARREQELSRRETELAALSAKAQTAMAASGGSTAGQQQLLDDLSRRLSDLDKRQSTLAEVDHRLAARKQELSLREAELDQLKAGLAGQSAAHQSKADELVRREAELEKTRQAHQAELHRVQQQQSEVRRLESELKLQSQALTEREREMLRQRRHVAQQLRARKKELTAEVELHRSEALASGAGQELQLQMRLSELQGKYDRLREELDEKEQQRDEATRQLAELKGQLAARQGDSQQQHVALEQAQRKQSDLEAECKKLQGDLQRHLENSGKQAEAARIDLARRTTEAQTQAAEIGRLTAELERTRRDSQEQIDRLRTDHGKSHDVQLQSLHGQFDELRKKVATEQAAWDTQRKQLEAQLKAAEKAAQGGGKAKPEVEKELTRLQGEKKQLETMLAAAEAKAKQGGGAGGGSQEIDDLRRRFEMAVQDVRELKTKNSDLTEQLAKAKSAGGAAASAGGATDWESMKKRMMQQMEDDFDASNEKEKAAKLTIEGAMKITDEVVAEKEKEIQELRRALDSQAQSVGEVAVGAAAIAQMLDSDELVKQERESLQKLQEGLREQLRKAEIDISLERAKLARERSELDEKLRTIEAERPAPGAVADDGKGKKGGGRKWLERLGLGDSGKG